MLERELALKVVEYLNEKGLAKFKSDLNLFGRKYETYIYKDMETREKHIKEMTSKGYKSVDTNIRIGLYSNLMSDVDDSVYVPTASFEIVNETDLVSWIKNNK